MFETSFLVKKNSSHENIHQKILRMNNLGQNYQSRKFPH